MPFNATIQPYNHVLNPVWVTIQGSALKDYSYKVKNANSEVIYTGAVTGDNFKFNIDEIVRSLITDLDVAAFTKQSVITRYLPKYLSRFSVEISDNVDTISLSAYAVPGGISDRLFRAITASGSDAFQSILFNTDLNFALTTRTRDNEIFIRETELMPLLFLSYFQRLTIKNGADEMLVIDGENASVSQAISVDINLLRKSYMSSAGKIVNRFEFYTDDHFSFAVNVTASAETRGYAILFLNSFNVWEKAEICGELDFVPERDEDTAAYKAYDQITDTLVDKRTRVKITEIIKADMGYCDDYRRAFLSDMLTSPCCYLCVDGNLYECTVSADAISISKSKAEPASFPVSVKLIDHSSLVTPFIDYTKVVRVKRMFDKYFSDKFR